MRSSVQHWWFDASAQALGEGYRDYTYSLPVSGSVQEMDYSELQPGDLAVTKGGAHMLAYLGGEKWIQADPGLKKVTIQNGKLDDNLWFSATVTMHRWSLLKESQED